MPIFKIFPVFSKKIKQASQKILGKAGHSALDWFRGRVTDAFGRKKVRTAGAFNQKEIKAQQQAMEMEIAKQNKVRGRPAQAKTPEKEIQTAQSQKVRGRVANDPDVTVSRDPKIQKQLSTNTTLDATFKKNLRNTKRPLIGHMYFYIYDPKWKKILPYYDVFPLVIPLDYYPDGFLGMNLHYLPYLLRAKLLDFLFTLEYKTSNDQKYMAVSYGVLKGLAGSSGYEPTIKRYLYSHVRSPFAEVLSDEWENAAFLPVEQFRKANKREVWADSRKKV